MPDNDEGDDTKGQTTRYSRRTQRSCLDHSLCSPASVSDYFLQSPIRSALCICSVGKAVDGARSQRRVRSDLIGLFEYVLEKGALQGCLYRGLCCQTLDPIDLFYCGLEAGLIDCSLLISFPLLSKDFPLSRGRFEPRLPCGRD